MSFMQKQVTRKMRWYEMETPCGTFAVPVEDIDGGKLADVLATKNEDDFTDEFREEMSELLLPYCEALSIDSVSVREGYGARLSAPGYLDCTEWTVFNTPQEAQAYLEEMYGDEEEEEENK